MSASAAPLGFELSDEASRLRDSVRELCADFPSSYWRGLEPDRYPDEFVAALTPTRQTAASSGRWSTAPSRWRWSPA